MSDSYYNTTHIHGVQLREYEAKAEAQEERVAEWFRHNPDVEATPEDVGRLVLPKAPRHSLSRVLRNLTTQMVLEKVPDKTVEGSYGRPIGFWRLRKSSPKVQEPLF